ncbi:uncharacterized protein LOC133200389 [Saccostrea echinata]|uniref:uncharacterized protein LOC133200389 n=1 Tax=Saccostrea echinata TaxID=191078 RepID=UPI002A822844|nr:uncharacterized protein LOC133200389 [Saccostrea echinata]
MCNSKQDIIRKDVQKLESELAPAFESIFSEIEIMESDVLNKHGERRQAITEFGRKCHKVVDIVMTKYLSDSKEIERRDLDSIKSLKAKIQDQKSSVKSEIQEKHSILESKDAFKLASYTSKNNEYRDVPSWFELKIPPFHPNELSELALFQLIGEIPETEKTYIRGHVLEEPEIVGTVSTGNHETNRVNCIPNTNEFYVCGVSEIIKRMNTEGELLEMITTKSKTSPSNLTVNREGDLIYTDVDDKNIYIVKNGQIRCLIRLFKWTPRGICSTSSDDLLVALLLKGDTKIVRYSDSTVTQEIQYKDTGEPLYHDPASMEENKNGDIVVSNWATNTVVVVNNEGKFKFEYKGNHQNNLEDTFTPDGVATDSMCHILIADRNNHIVHVIDRNGQILVYIDSCNIQYPYDLSTDSKDMLFVAEFKTDLVKVIKYLK